MPPTNALCTSRPEPEPEPEPEIEEPGVFGDVIDPSTSASIGAGITGAVAGGILADSLVTAANVGLTGELLTDAGVIGAVLLGGGAVYASQRPDEAGEPPYSELARLPLSTLWRADWSGGTAWITCWL